MGPIQGMAAGGAIRLSLRESPSWSASGERRLILRCDAFAVSTRRSASPVSVFASDVAVGMSIKRVHQHRTVSRGVGDGRELFRRPYNGRLSLISSVLSTLRGGSKVTENRYGYPVLASGTCPTHCTHNQYSWGGSGHRKPGSKRR